jgi:predicted amino acid-binding ACT domain protein
VQGDDKVGALTAILSKLAKARVNITSLDAVVAGKGRFGAMFWVKPKNVAKTAKLLHAK